MHGGFALFPHGVLRNATWYTAHATGHVRADLAGSESDLPFDLTWRFQTVKHPSGAEVQRRNGVLKFTSANPNPADVTVTQAGVPVAQLALRPGGRWRAPLPVGEYRVCVHQPETATYVAFDSCRAWTLMRLTGKLRAGRARITVTVPPSGAARRVRVTVRHDQVQCAPGGSNCWHRTATPYERTLRIASAKTIVARVRRSVRRAQVSVSVGPQTVGGRRFPSARATLLLRRRKTNAQ
jgi:hypothetical protein